MKKNSANAYENELIKNNSNFKFWIKVDGTNIDYPVVQYSDNEYYLYRDFNNKKSSSGSIFLDCNSDFENDKNPILYGHNMKSKTMFSQLEKFKNKNFFYDENKIRVLKNGKEYIYEVFSVYYTQPSFGYNISDFDSDEEYEKYIKKVRDKSLLLSDVSVNSTDRIITLSTCSYEAKNNRTVVHAKLISSDNL